MSGRLPRPPPGQRLMHSTPSLCLRTAHPPLPRRSLLPRYPSPTRPPRPPAAPAAAPAAPATPAAMDGQFSIPFVI